MDRRLRVGLFAIAVLTSPLTAAAQEAVLFGTVADATGAVLPGATIEVVHEETGNTYATITDARGGYQLPVRIGAYRLTAKLDGFTTVTRPRIDVLVGQRVPVHVAMSLSSVEESITVTGVAPLVDTSESSIGTNIDSRLVSELPVNGRNWVDLTLLAAGMRANHVQEDPAPGGTFQLNVDGQQVTNNLGPGFFSPHYSKDAIAEFEVITNRFDATQGRSTGMQVNAVTKSGTNAFAGTFSGFMRDDRFIAKDFVLGRVLPYQNVQFSGTLGGPIRKDRMHFFVNYEREREPITVSSTSQYPRFNFDQTGVRSEYKFLARVDMQFTSATRLSIRGMKQTNRIPYDPRYSGGATMHPSGAIEANRYSQQLQASLTQVLSNRAFNEIKGGYVGNLWEHIPYATWSNHPRGLRGAPEIRLTGYEIGAQHLNAPQDNRGEPWSIRDELTVNFSGAGNHNLKTGGEYIYYKYGLFACINCMGIIDATGGPVPANIQDLFPDPYNVDTWNLAALSPITRRYSVGLGPLDVVLPSQIGAAWLQDDWQVSPRLTLNLGLRWDYTSNTTDRVEVPPILFADRQIWRASVDPRLGFALRLHERTAVRGGYGTFHSGGGAGNYFSQVWAEGAQPTIEYDGRPDFTSNPFNGPQPTVEQVRQSYCSVNNRPGCIRPSLTRLSDPVKEISYSHQTSIGAQQQIGESMNVEVDYVWVGARLQGYAENLNLSYNPATGTNYSFSDISRRPYPDWGVIQVDMNGASSNLHSVQSAFTKRWNGRWQAHGTYTLSWLRDMQPPPLGVDFPLQPDFGGEYTLAAGDQRHRAVLSGIVDLGFGFQASSLYFYGSGLRYATSYGGDLRQQGAAGSARLRPDVTIVPRNNFVGEPIHRVDARLQRRFRVGRGSIDGSVEVFNLFNHANYGSYTTQESSPNYGRPTANTNVAYQPRMLQLGFRVAF